MYSVVVGESCCQRSVYSGAKLALRTNRAVQCVHRFRKPIEQTLAAVE